MEEGWAINFSEWTDILWGLFERKRVAPQNIEWMEKFYGPHLRPAAPLEFSSVWRGVNPLLFLEKSEGMEGYALGARNLNFVDLTDGHQTNQTDDKPDEHAAQTGFGFEKKNRLGGEKTGDYHNQAD